MSHRLPVMTRLLGLVFICILIGAIYTGVYFIWEDDSPSILNKRVSINTIGSCNCIVEHEALGHATILCTDSIGRITKLSNISKKILIVCDEEINN